MAAAVPIQLLPSLYEAAHGVGRAPMLFVLAAAPLTAGAGAVAAQQPMIHGASSTHHGGRVLNGNRNNHAGHGGPQLADVRKHKHAVTAAYLSDIEGSVDGFLAQLGVQVHAVPDNYLDVPPQPGAMQHIQVNADLLTHLAQEAFNPGSALRRQLLDPLTRHVWADFLEPLRKWLLAQQLQCATTTASPGVSAELAADLAHLDKMQRLEETYLLADDAPLSSGAGGDEAARPRVGVSDVVPVAGLAMGRIHRLLNEQRTVLEHWTPARVAAHREQIAQLRGR